MKHVCPNCHSDHELSRWFSSQQPIHALVALTRLGVADDGKAEFVRDPHLFVDFNIDHEAVIAPNVNEAIKQLVCALSCEGDFECSCGWQGPELALATESGTIVTQIEPVDGVQRWIPTPTEGMTT